MTIDLTVCIACHRLDRFAECTWDCKDKRLRLVERRDLLLLEDAVDGLPDPPEPVEAWLCMTCGRIEAPQPCLGVCVKQPVEMVTAEEYDAARARVAEDY